MRFSALNGTPEVRGARQRETNYSELNNEQYTVNARLVQTRESKLEILH